MFGNNMPRTKWCAYESSWCKGFTEVELLNYTYFGCIGPSSVSPEKALFLPAKE